MGDRRRVIGSFRDSPCWYENQREPVPVLGQLGCRCSLWRHADQPTPSHRREHVRHASAQVNGVIVASAVGKIDDLHWTGNAVDGRDTALD